MLANRFNHLLFVIAVYPHFMLQTNKASVSVIIYSIWHKKYQEACEIAAKRKNKSCIKWSQFNRLLSNRQFHRYFRMDRACFYQLCKKIEIAVGEDVFLSEKFLKYTINEEKYEHLKKMNVAHEYSTGGLISGEMKVAITLRLLSGALYLDLGLLFVTSYSTIYWIFHYMIH